MFHIDLETEQNLLQSLVRILKETLGLTLKLISFQTNNLHVFKWSAAYDSSWENKDFVAAEFPSMCHKDFQKYFQSNHKDHYPIIEP